MNKSIASQERHRPLKKRVLKERGSTTEDSKVVRTKVQTSLEAYFESIRKYSLLSNTEEKELFARVERGDKEARRQTIEANLRLVINIAKRYMNRGLPLLDLIEEGNIGLIRAVERFDLSKGCKFSTYATYWIKQAVERSIMNQSKVIRVPIHVAGDLYRKVKVEKALTKTLGREPTEKEVAEQMGLSSKQIKKLNMVSTKSCSIDAALSDSTDETLLDRIEDQDSPSALELIGEVSRSKEVKRWIEMLEEKEQIIINMRFGLNGDPQTLEKVGLLIGVTRERVRQLEIRAIKKLRDIVGSMDINSLEAI